MGKRRRKGASESPPHQVSMVFDLNKCIGCQTCSTACKRLWTRNEGMEHMWWATVNTRPGRGTPRDWESMGGGFKDEVPVEGHLPEAKEFGEAWKFNYEDVFYGGNGAKTQLKPKEKPEWGPNWDEDQGGGEYPNNYFFYMPRICNHCTHPACLAACPRNAIEKREEDGIVLINEERCRGYRFCMEACPYKKIYFNQARQVAQKCIFCFPRVEQGVAPACARMCPGRVRFAGYVDDEEGPIYKLVHEWKVAIPLHPEYETQPNIFYVPPLAPLAHLENGKTDPTISRIPAGYLEHLFGPVVHAALATLKAEMARQRAGEKSELIDLLISRRWLDMFHKLERDPAELENVMRA